MSCVLVVSPVLATQGVENVEDVMDELMNYTEEPAPDAGEASAVTAEAKKPSSTVEAQGNPSKIETSETANDPDKPIVMQAEPMESIENTPVGTYSGRSRNGNSAALTRRDVKDMEMSELLRLMEQGNGITAAEQQNLDILITADPENEADRTYIQRLLAERNERNRLEHDRQKVKIDGMTAVDAAWSTELTLRSYSLVSGAGVRMQLGNVTSAMDVERLFPQVDFPKGASAIYQPETETIFVNNTPENLAVLEMMLETMGVLKGFDNTYQVEIEAKFVEVSEGTLEELGFQWNLDPGFNVGNVELNDGANGSLTEPLRGSPVPFQRKIDLGDGNVSASGDWSTFRLVDTFNTAPAGMNVVKNGGNGFDLLISALDQSTGADMLSAPRILTRSGEEATIQVGEIHYFPEVYEGDSAQATIVNISYEDFEEKLLGVELTVTPKVTDERDIMLELNPRISELVGWQTYQLAPADSIYNHRQRDTNQPFDHDPIVASLPILKKREIKTQVTMADGSTIGMGGLINEKVEAFDDSVPILGRIPLMGRLFRSEGERVVKRNLLMFVTARIIDPNGRIDPTRSFE
jgi:type II secretory pathway component GspD/PulD (secretin)